MQSSSSWLCRQSSSPSACRALGPPIVLASPEGFSRRAVSPDHHRLRDLAPAERDRRAALPLGALPARVVRPAHDAYPAHGTAPLRVPAGLRPSDVRVLEAGAADEAFSALSPATRHQAPGLSRCGASRTARVFLVRLETLCELRLADAVLPLLVAPQLVERGRISPTSPRRLAAPPRTLPTFGAPVRGSSLRCCGYRGTVPACDRSAGARLGSMQFPADASRCPRRLPS